MVQFQSPFRLPRGATEIVLVRHGASTAMDLDAAVALVGGHADHGLTPLGRAQAEHVAERLAAEHPPAVIGVTPLRRTAETAAPLARRTAIDPVVVGELREVRLGEWEAGNEFARRMAADDPVVREAFERERWDVLPGGEPADVLAARVAAGISRLTVLAGPDSRAVMFTHGGVIAEACRQATGSRPFAFLGNENAAITRLVATPTGWTLRAFNDASHLG